jgi:photosystem II stability/assembly factor-like uncharacterized protein
MDTTTRGGRLSPRARRALPLIAAAVLVTAGASVAYLRPSLLQLPAPPKAVGPALLSNDYSAAYTFLTPSLGWALVAETTSATPRFSVFKTTDSAKHWKRLLVKQPNQISLGSLLIRFFDASHGVIALGNPTEIYRTSDGGTHWALVKTPNYFFSFFVPADALHGWLLSWSGRPDQSVPNLLSTSDGGDTWTALPQTLPWANGSAGFPDANFSFRNAREGWVGASAAEPTVYASTDGGVSWQPHTMPSNLDSNLCTTPLSPGAPGPWTTYVSLLPGHGVVAILNHCYGRVEGYTSVDGGATWRALASPPGSTSLGDFAFQDSSHWWAMGAGDLWKSSDAGGSWKLVSQQLDGWQYSPHVIDANHAWAELYISKPSWAPGAGLAVTSDGGVHWSQVNAPQPG